MKPDIVDFVRKAIRKYGVEAAYLPDGDLYVITKDGKAVQNFTTYHFYQQPQYFRLREYEAIINLGLNHNMGEAHVSQLSQLMAIGKKIT